MTYPYSAAVEASLERVADLDLDPTAPVYQRLFALHPELEGHFWRDQDGAIRGEMLTRVFEAILDFIGDRRFSGHIISTEMVTHEGYDVPREAFSAFFRVVADTLAELLGADWTPATAAAWAQMLADIDAYAGATPRSDVLVPAMDLIRREEAETYPR